MLQTNFKSVRAAREGLLEQLSILRKIQEELEQAEHRIKDMSFTANAYQLLKKRISEIQEGIYSFQKMADCLKQAEEIYRKTEQQIADTYDLEIIVYPKTVFAQSSFSS